MVVNLRSLPAGPHVVVVGSGIGGLSAAAVLAAQGVRVTVLERAATFGGKVRHLVVGGRPIDAGPTVFTMKWVFEELFAAAGADFDARVPATRLDVIARHAWGDRSAVDLYGEIDRTADAIAAFAGPREADGYRRLAADTAVMFEVSKAPFLLSDTATPLSFVSREGLATLAKLKALETMWGALGGYFRDARLRQLFGRYATYTGASPFEAPATLMLIAHVERDGCWAVEGGMHAVADGLAALAIEHGATIRTGAEVAEIRVRGGMAAGVTLADGETVEADAVVSNAEINALAGGRFGPAAAGAVTPVKRHQRTLSAITFCALANVDGMELARHTVFFGADCRREFRDLFGRRRVPEDASVYICAQDRGPRGERLAGGPAERLLIHVNAPADGDERPYGQAEIEACWTRVVRLIERCGARLSAAAEQIEPTTPAGFETLFPSSGGSLYGKAMHGWAAASGRPPARTAIPRLYIVGAGAHPGPGVPMVALSGRKAAAAILSDFASTRRSGLAAIAGGTSTR